MFSELAVDKEDIARLAQEDPVQFALLRRRGFGASDSSIILGVNHWTKLPDLIAQKNSAEVTPEELAINKKPQVRMGSELEPLILNKAESILGTLIEKPSAQYRFVDYPWLTVNYDGVIGFGSDQDFMICEAKCVSHFARKYWNWDRGYTIETYNPDDILIQRPIVGSAIDKDILENSEKLGIPPYYYTQVQQQLIGTKKSLAFLAALDVLNWEVRVFPVPENEFVQQGLISLSLDAAECCDNIPTSQLDGFMRNL
jgi:predicted phage-related endonuclease